MASFDETLNYVAVAASQTTLAVGAHGNVGDYIQSITVIPATSAAGAWVLHDGPGTSVTLLTVPALSGGTGVPLPYNLYLGIKCKKAGFNVTTGANVSLLLVGHFT